MVPLCANNGVDSPMTSKAESWYLLNSGPGAAAFNMAFDETLLEFVARLGRPVLRFYGWTERAASFGYSQKFADVAGMTRLRPLVRRATGGGLVPHDADWTYSLVFPLGNWWYALRAPESYRTVHQWIRGAFARLKVETELASGSRRGPPGQCFVGAERDDVVGCGRKIAGSARSPCARTARSWSSALRWRGLVRPPLFADGRPGDCGNPELCLSQ